MGADLALGHRIIGFPAVFAVGNGVDGLPQELTVLQHGIALAVPFPHVNKVIRDHRGDLANLQGHSADVLGLVVPGDFHHAVGNVEYNA